MDIYNKWCMRASGEGKHQANSGSEARVRATVEQMFELESFKITFTGMSSEERSELFNKLYETDCRISQNWKPKPPIHVPWWHFFKS